MSSLEFSIIVGDNLPWVITRQTRCLFDYQGEDIIGYLQKDNNLERFSPLRRIFNKYLNLDLDLRKQEWIPGNPKTKVEGKSTLTLVLIQINGEFYWEAFKLSNQNNKEYRLETFRKDLLGNVILDYNFPKAEVETHTFHTFIDYFWEAGKETKIIYELIKSLNKDFYYKEKCYELLNSESKERSYKLLIRKYNKTISDFLMRPEERRKRFLQLCPIKRGRKNLLSKLTFSAYTKKEILNIVEQNLSLRKPFPAKTYRTFLRMKFNKRPVLIYNKFALTSPNQLFRVW